MCTDNLMILKFSRNDKAVRFVNESMIDGISEAIKDPKNIAKFITCHCPPELNWSKKVSDEIVQYIDNSLGLRDEKTTLKVEKSATETQIYLQEMLIFIFIPLEVISVSKEEN